MSLGRLEWPPIVVVFSYFHVVIWRGETIQAWFEAGYQDKEEYANFRQLLAAPEQDAKAILNDRFPVSARVFKATLIANSVDCRCLSSSRRARVAPRPVSLRPRLTRRSLRTRHLEGSGTATMTVLW